MGMVERSVIFDLIMGVGMWLAVKATTPLQGERRERRGGQTLEGQWTAQTVPPTISDQWILGEYRIGCTEMYGDVQ